MIELKMMFITFYMYLDQKLGSFKVDCITLINLYLFDWVSESDSGRITKNWTDVGYCSVFQLANQDDSIFTINVIISKSKWIEINR